VGCYKARSSSKFSAWSSAFLIYINNLPPTINTQSTPVLFADDSNIIISHPQIDHFQNCRNDVFAGLNKWIKANKLTLNFDRTNFTKVCTNNKTCVDLNIQYDDKSTTNQTTKIDDNLNWKAHI
jgi:hypothetical protein